MGGGYAMRFNLWDTYVNFISDWSSTTRYPRASSSWAGRTASRRLPSRASSTRHRLARLTTRAWGPPLLGTATWTPWVAFPPLPLLEPPLPLPERPALNVLPPRRPATPGTARWQEPCGEAPLGHAVRVNGCTCW